MLNRLRSGVLAGGGALLLVLSISGMAMGASLTSDSGPVDTSFVDVDGDGVADHCQTEAAAENTEAAQAAFDAADLNDDGVISVSEAAQSGWTGGVNCNHGGYVSEVAQAGVGEVEIFALQEVLLQPFIHCARFLRLAVFQQPVADAPEQHRAEIFRLKVLRELPEHRLLLFRHALRVEKLALAKGDARHGDRRGVFQKR